MFLDNNKIMCCFNGFEGMENLIENENEKIYTKLTFIIFI